jgi:hypothetical protein
MKANMKRGLQGQYITIKKEAEPFKAFMPFSLLQSLLLIGQTDLIIFLMMPILHLAGWTV